MNRPLKVLAGATIGALMAFSASAEDHISAKTVLATVDGIDITVGHVVALRGRLPQQYQSLPDEVLFQGILDQLIQHTILMQALESEIDTRIELGLENERRAFLAGEKLARITEQEISEEELRAAYTERFDAAIPEQEYNASHILVATKAEAEELIKLLDDGADFATLAREKSTGPSGPNGGQLGWFGKGQMVKPFEDAVLQMAVGEVAGPVETQFGWHVIKMNEIRNLEVPSFDDVRADLAMELQESKTDAEMERLAEAANITRHDVDVDPSIIRDVSVFDE